VLRVVVLIVAGARIHGNVGHSEEFGMKAREIGASASL
jgi:hypothetical protein